MSKINIMALRHSAFYSPLLMTMAGGFLKQQGLDYDYTLPTAGQDVKQHLAQGLCHISQSAVATSFAELEQGRVPDIVHFAKINSRDGFFIAGRQADKGFDWHQLKGKTLLADHFFQPFAMLQYALHRQGIDMADINIVDAGDVDAIDRAFRDGQGDYVHQQGPAPQQMQKEGVAQVVAAVGDAIGPVAFSSLCATRAWLETDMALAFMQAYRQALAYVMEAPAAEIAVRQHQAGFFTDIDRSVLTDTLAAYQQLGCWSYDPVISEQEYKNLLDVFLFSGAIQQPHDYHKAIVPPPGLGNNRPQ